MFTTIPYLYQDASNWKEHSEIVIRGLLSAGDIELIQSALEDGSDFIPFDLGFGIEEMQPRMMSYPSDDDLIYHELLLSEVKVSATVPEGVDTIEATDFVAAFENVKNTGGWKVVEASERLEIY